MSHHILLGTRKGTLIVDRKNGRWTPRPIAHPGVSISFAARDPRDGTLWVAMDHGHWGPKLARSRDEGRTWEGLTQIAYPKGARFVEQHLPTPDQDPNADKPTTYKDAALLKVWVWRSARTISRASSTPARCPAASSPASTAASTGSSIARCGTTTAAAAICSPATPRRATSGAARRRRSHTASSSPASTRSSSIRGTATTCTL